MKNFVLILMLMGLIGLFQGCAEEASDSNVIAAGDTYQTPGGGTGIPAIPGGVNVGGASSVVCVDDDGDGQFAISTTCKQGIDCDDTNPEIFQGAGGVNGCSGKDCTPDCDGKTCGPDGCGDVCGTCSNENACNTETGICEGECVPNCNGIECGDDGCGGICGTCPVGSPCTDGQCLCAPKCTGKTCGPDGCGGTCGDCDADQLCDLNGACQCKPDCEGKQCGPDGCGGVCNDGCGPGAICTDDFQCVLETSGTESCANLGCGFSGTAEDPPDCFCDEACFGYGDCCADICDACGTDFPAQCACEDADGDLYGEGPGCLGPDCDDTNPDANPGAAEVCGNGIDDDCNTFADDGCETGECLNGSDEDGDGFYDSPACQFTDCNDTNEDVYPGATEICGNGIDDDCLNGDAVCPENNCVDEDGDNYGVGDGCIGPDCNDSDPFQNPGVSSDLDVCGDGIDQDCKDGDPVCPEACVDADGDGFYAIVEGCDDGTDCDDGNALINPGVDAELDLCDDGIDQDCKNGDPVCSDGECSTDANCEAGKWCDLSQGLCEFPKYWQMYAPEIWLETDEDGEDLDFFTNLNFDGDYNAANNPANADSVAKNLYVYYSYVKTATHAYVGYHFYFPRRWSDAIAFGTNYDNTMRHVLLVIDITSDAGVNGTLQAMFTTGENNVREYRNAESALEGSSDGDILFSDVNGYSRPRIYIDSENHNIAGNPGDAGFGVSDTDEVEFKNDNGYKLSWDWTASKMDPAFVDNLSGTETYALLEMVSELWPERANLGEDKLFEEFGIFAGDDTTSDSTAPWAYEETSSYPAGELLWDPATFVSRKFSNGWGDFSRSYTYNPYVLKVTLIDLTIQEDSELFGDPEPYLNLYLRDGKGDEHKVLGRTGGAQNNWNPGEVPAGTAFYLQAEMDRNWFYGLDVPGTDYMGLEVREKDNRGDDWLMIPGERYYDSYEGTSFLNFLNSTMNVKIELN